MRQIATDYTARIKALRRLIRTRAEAALITNLKNIFYLSGFTGSSASIIITQDRALFFTDFRYKEQSAAETGGLWEINIVNKRGSEAFSGFIKKLGIKSLAFESTVTYEYWESLRKTGIKTIPLRGALENMRRVKSADEIERITRALRRAESAFLKIKPRIKPGIKELQIAGMLEQELKAAGCRRLPFDIIAASGKNSSMPHARPTEKKVAAGDLVILDWGGEADGYFSDISRTLLMAGGSNLAEKKKIYNIVKEALGRAVASARSGISSRTVDSAARDFIKQSGYGEHFGHGTGHGVGIDVHEAPRITYSGSSRLGNGMVFTIEPGIYLPGTGGVRIEDMVHIKDGKAEVMTKLSRGIEIVRA
ncbi:MAG: Xaa-Pro peptidase family protein [Nitrospiraceae bacterium]|nr:Xaa-Pro peptidase family protein [Nitrospiraceae bacterium]